MHAMTKANLEAAFAGESQAHMKYMAFAAKAEQEGDSHPAGSHQEGEHHRRGSN